MVDLPNFLEQLLAKPPSQLFLMGDIFQILVGSVAYTHPLDVLEQIESLSRQIPVFYFEGNHDFGLQSLPQLKNTTIYPRNAQPVAFSCQDKFYHLMHGDLFLGFGYGLYIRLLSSRLALKILGFLAHIKPLYTAISTPIYAKKIKNFSQSGLDFTRFAKTRLVCCTKNSTQPLWGVIEGHFHIGCIYQKSQLYVALPSFYCTKEVVKFTDLGWNICPTLP
ncbi:UDP-2,3-diacylglucosamine hydrolase [Helicobacter gastrofelis]|nr:UDP-2,3-diacylglucosamine hydrolase [Helicobacter sp. NHP19-012]